MKNSESTTSKNWPLYIVAVASLLVIVVRLIWPSLNFDNISLIMFAIGSAALLMPYLPPLKSLEAGPVKAEFQLNAEIRSLEKNVVATEAAPIPPRPAKSKIKGEVVSWEHYFEEYFRIVNSPISNVEKILSASILVERMVLNVAKSFNLPDVTERTSTRQVVERLWQHELIGQEEKAAFLDFWSIRNTVVHGGIGNPNDEQTARILDLVWRLVRTLA